MCQFVHHLHFGEHGLHFASQCHKLVLVDDLDSKGLLPFLCLWKNSKMSVIIISVIIISVISSLPCAYLLHMTYQPHGSKRPGSQLLDKGVRLAHTILSHLLHHHICNETQQIVMVL